MAMTTDSNVTWANDGVDDADIDTETMYLHENGHVIALGHSAAVMAPFYDGSHCSLASDDKEGVTYLYDNGVTGTVTNKTKPIFKASVVLEGTSLGVTIAKDGTYTIYNIPDRVSDTLTATKGGATASIDRLTIDGSASGVDLVIGSTDDGGGNGSGGGGACPPKKQEKGKR